MSGDTLRIVVCWAVLLLHVATIAVSPILIVNFSEALDVILILMPLTGLYVGIVVNFYANQKTTLSRDRFSRQFAALTIFLVLAFSFAIVGSQYLYYIGRVETIAELKRAAGIVDTGLGVYSGFLVKRLFRS